MKKRTINKFIASIMLALGIVASPGLVAVQPAYAQDASEAECEALGSVNSNSCTTSSNTQISTVIEVALNILSIAAGIIAVISLIISGLKYITAQGDANSISSARSSVIYAIVGISIVVLSQVIVRFVINQTTTVAPPNAPGTFTAPVESGNPPPASVTDPNAPGPAPGTFSDPVEPGAAAPPASNEEGVNRAIILPNN